MQPKTSLTSSGVLNNDLLIELLYYPYQFFCSKGIGLPRFSLDDRLLSSPLFFDTD
jgi:hypothetical protein